MPDVDVTHSKGSIAAPELLLLLGPRATDGVEHPRAQLGGIIMLTASPTDFVDEAPLELGMRAAVGTLGEMCVDRGHLRLVELAIEIIPERAYDGLAISGRDDGHRHQMDIKG